MCAANMQERAVNKEVQALPSMAYIREGRSGTLQGSDKLRKDPEV